ncbi:MAG: phosphodiester glycosidase family protein [Verrucomicrobia bacterium]|nr:phosphodiester glycosidase family protein [Verrucomicrobiota bacterium]
MWHLLQTAVAALLLLLAGCGRPGGGTAALPEWAPGLAYTNSRVAKGPWSIHIVRMERGRPELALESVHAGGRALGLSPLTEQLRQIVADLGAPVAAVNGDFYQRDRPHAGDPRGLQIANGELLSAPDGGAAFWTDAGGQPRTGPVRSRLQVEWPEGGHSPMGLNQERGPDDMVLFTEAAGPSTQTPRGRELILIPEGSSPARPVRLAPGAQVTARVREVREQGDTPIAPGTWVLSLGPEAARKHPVPAVGSLLTLSTATEPDLAGSRTAIGGGPVLITQGRVQKIRAPEGEDSYVFTSMQEQHPRSAVGWNDTHLFLVLVDGRQPGLSVGMTLEELARTLRDLGCTEAMNLDGGGSATLWADGRIRNSPCDGQERPVANALVVTRKTNGPAGGTGFTSP